MMRVWSRASASSSLKDFLTWCQHILRIHLKPHLRIRVKFDDERQGCEESDLLILVVHETAS
jgi:hypothetical protein